MKRFFILLSALISLSAHAGFVTAIPDGSYKGKRRGQGEGPVHLMVKSHPGCEGCFIAILLDSDDLFDRKVELAAFSALPLERVIVGGIETSTQYSLTPIGVDDNGDLSIPNENPSMVMTVLPKGIGTTDAYFTLGDAQSDNNRGIVTSLFAWERESPFTIIGPTAGTYRLPGESKVNATISQVTQNEIDRAHTVQFSWFGNVRQRGGNFILKEKLPDIYSFNSLSYFAEGKKAQRLTKKIVMFVKRRGKEHLLMVNPIDSRDVSCLFLKDNLSE